MSEPTEKPVLDRAHKEIVGSEADRLKHIVRIALTGIEDVIISPEDIGDVTRFLVKKIRSPRFGREEKEDGQSMEMLLRGLDIAGKIKQVADVFRPHGIMPQLVCNLFVENPKLFFCHPDEVVSKTRLLHQLLLDQDFPGAPDEDALRQVFTNVTVRNLVMRSNEEIYSIALLTRLTGQPVEYALARWEKGKAFPLKRAGRVAEISRIFRDREAVEAYTEENWARIGCLAGKANFRLPVRAGIAHHEPALPGQEPVLKAADLGFK